MVKWDAGNEGTMSGFQIVGAMPDELSGDDYGEDYGAEEVGFVTPAMLNRMRARRNRGRGMQLFRRSGSGLARPAIIPQVAGVNLQPTQGSTVLPLGNQVFINGGPVLLNLANTSQVNIGPAKLVLTRHNVGVASPGLTVLVTDILIGNRSLFGAAGAMPVEAFDPQAVSNPLGGLPIGPGIAVTVRLSIDAAPAALETVSISGGFYGAGVM